MSFRHHNRGQMRVIEVLLASFIIVASLSFSSVLTVAPDSTKHEVSELEKLGTNVLHDLDSQGLLSRFIYQSEWQNLTSALQVLLPLDVYFNVTLFYSNHTMMSYPPIYYGNPISFSSSNNVASVRYGVVDYSSRLSNTSFLAIYDFRILVLQLVRG